MAKSKKQGPAALPDVVVRSIDTIEPYWRNPRVNNAGVEALARSISEFGWTQPIVIDPEGVIIAGHTRYKAARKLGLTEVPTVMLDLPEGKAKAYRIADNAVADQSTWDNELLLPELRALDMDMQGFFGDTLNLEGLLSEGPALDAVTAKQTEAAADDVVSSFAEGSAQRLVALTCPHCGNEFNIAEKDFEAQKGG